MAIRLLGVTMAAPLAYEDVRAAIVAEGSDARVEVNQRALIDKVRVLVRKVQCT